jgi:hypothetical protein
MPTYTNLIILQGWLEVRSLQTLTMDGQPVVVIHGWINTTDQDGLETFFGERHPVVISGRPAEAILEITRKLNEKFQNLSGISLACLSDELADQIQVLLKGGRPYVIAQGKLLTHDGQSNVDVKHISFLGLPWGALDALKELEPIMNRDVQALMAALTPLEKTQLSQALCVAMRALIALRPAYEPLE